MFLRKVLVIFTTLSYLEVFGLINIEETLAIPGMFKVYDILIILVVLYLLIVFIKNPKIYREISVGNPITKFITGFLLLVFVVLITMPLRGENILNSLKIARLFFALFLYYLILYDIIFSQSTKFWEKFVIIIGCIISIIILFTAFFPEKMQTIFVANKYKLERSVTGLARTYTAGFVFCFLGFIIQVTKYQISNNKNIILLSLFIIASLLQGFRSYLIITLIIVLYIAFIVKNKKISSKFILLLFLSASGLLLLPTLENRISTALLDLVKSEGTMGYRTMTDWYLRIPVFLENKFLGIGFVSSDSNFARSNGAFGDNMYNAMYSTDSGYLNLLLMFGIVGTAIFFIFTLLLIKYFISQYKLSRNESKEWIIISFSTILLLLGTLISHSGLTNIYGLIPLTFVFSIAQGNLVLSKSKCLRT